MIGVLDKIFDYIQHGPQQKKVEQYLHDITPDSLLDDLCKALSPSLSAINGLRTTFDTFSFHDPLQDDHYSYSYWTKESLRKHIEKVYPYADFSDTIIDLLWTCFYFYAYHPFPRRDVGGGRIGWPAFQRSVSLLALRGTKLLGTLEDGDYSWRYDESFTHRVNFNRMLRSISLPGDADTQQQLQPGCDTSTLIVDDVMDVLAMTQPQDISVHPSPDLLKPVAQKLISESATPVQYWIKGEELSLLLSLLLRLRLYETKWARKEFHYGTFDEQCPQGDELAHILTERLTGGKGTVLTSDQAQEALEILPGLEFYFHQLWSTLFQPPMSANISTQETAERDPNLDRILRMTSWFISQHDSQKSHNSPVFERLDTPSSQVLSDDMSLSRLVKALSRDCSRPDHPAKYNILIVTGNTSMPIPTPVVIGAIFPDMPWATNPDNTKEKKWEGTSKLTTSHILFQLRPKFRLLPWTGLHMPQSTDFIRLDHETTASGKDIKWLKDIVTDSKISQKSYWIGSPEGTKTGLHIDPDTRVAILRTFVTPSESGDGGRYEELGVERDVDGDAGLEEEFHFTASQIAVFKVESGTHANVCSGENSTRKDDPRYGNQGNETRLEGDELAKRIQGFGST